MGVEVLALAPWVFTAVIGAWLVLTGRRLIPWLPEGVREGWRLRAIGLLYCVVAALFAYWVIQGDPSGLMISWIAVGTGVWVAFVRWRKTGTRGA